MKSPIIAPSVLSADFGHLQRDVEMLNNSAADWLHVDIMDGIFVPNISFGFPVMKALQKTATKPLDVHLMIARPDEYISLFRDHGAAHLTVHYEACVHLHRTIQNIRSQGMKAGVVLNPHTPVSVLQDIIHDLDIVLIMSVNPGFGGQKFIEHTYRKVEEARRMIDDAGSATIIEVDGGVNATNAPLLLKAGAQALVAGSFVFDSADPMTTIQDLKNIRA